MKKLIVMLGAVACAIGVQAATLNWTITGVKFSSDATSDLTKYTALLYFSDAVGTVGSTFDTVAQTDAIAALTGSGVASGYVLAKNLNSAGAATGATGLSSAFGAGDSVTGYAIILDGSIDNYSNYIIAGPATATFTSATGAKALGFGTQASAAWQSAAVPEPTSSLLMLVGLAGLALRRKRS